jgi:hypothetical protein
MSRLRMPLALLLLAGCASEAATQQPATGSGSLGRAVARAGADAGGPVWVAWEVPATSRRNTCCFDRQFQRSACRLEEKRQSWGSTAHQPPGTGRLLVLARWAGDQAGRVLAVDSACPVDPGNVPLVRLPDVSVEESAAWLAALAAVDRRRDESEPLAVLAYHAGTTAMQALARLASAPHDFDRREQALFWIGQARGEEGARFLSGVVRDDADPDIREKAVFSLSQNPSPLSAQTLVEAARRDGDPDVRGQALFWLAQTKEEAEPVLLAALAEDPSRHVREQAIFAMTQLPGGGVPLLVSVARDRRRDPEIRRQAMFWLGQSKDPRALDFLEEVLR